HFDSRASYFAAVHSYYARYVQILMLLDHREPGKGFAEKAFDASERSRASSLLDLLNASSQGEPCDELLQRQLQQGSQSDIASAKQAVSDAAPILSPQQVQSEIEDDGTLLLEYSLGDETSYVWTIDQHRIVAHPLPQQDRIRKVVQLFRE